MVCHDKYALNIRLHVENSALIWSAAFATASVWDSLSAGQAIVVWCSSGILRA
jgi:hypothetical protein